MDHFKLHSQFTAFIDLQSLIIARQITNIFTTFLCLKNWVELDIFLQKVHLKEKT